MSSGNRLHYFTFGLALALASQALGQEPGNSQERPNHNQEEGEHDKAQPPEQPTVIAPSLPPLISAEPPGESHNHDHQKSEGAESDQALFEWKAWFVRRDTVAQWIMAFFGIVATGVSIWAVLLLRSTLKATREAVGEARAGMRTAEKAVEVTSETAKHQLRAYLLIDDVMIEEGPAGRNIKAALLNSGQTPARSVKGFIGFVVGQAEEPHFAVDLRRLKGTRDVGPSQVLKLIKNIAEARVSQQVWQDIDAGGTPFFAYGHMAYADVFGDPHSTIFRFKYHARDKVFYVAAEGNQAD